MVYLVLVERKSEKGDATSPNEREKKTMAAFQGHMPSNGFSGQ
jgi:hypothetical protein